MGNDNAHAKISPSSLARLFHCPGSFTLGEENPQPSRDSIYSLEGTKAHEVGEIALVTNQEALAVTDDEEMAHYVQLYIDYCNEVVRRNQDPSQMVEVKLDLSEFMPESFGTADHISVDHVNKGWIDVTDLKYGKGVNVQAEDNPQLLAYGIGAAILVFGKELKGFKGLRLHVVQPRIGIPKKAEYDLLDVIKWKEDISRVSRDAWHGKREFKEGSGCGFCKVKHICPVKSNKAAAKVLRMFEPSEDELQEALKDKADVIEFFKAAENRLMEKLEAGEEVEGYKLEHKRGKRVWQDDVTDEEVEDIFTDSVKDLKVEDLYVKKLKSPTQVDNLLKKHGLDKEERDLLMSQFVDKPLGAKALKRDYENKA